MRRHDRHGSGKTHTYYDNFRSIPMDVGLEMPTALIERVGTKHLLVQTVTTGAAEMFKDDGSNHRFGIILELEGRFNRTDREGVQSAVLDVEAAVILYKNLQHSLGVLMDMGEL